MWCGVVAEQDLGKILWAPMLLLYRQGTEEVVEGPAETLTLDISLWVVGSGSGFTDTIQIAQLLNYNILKASILV